MFKKAVLLIFCALLFLAASCGGPVAGEVSYRPPGLPLRVSVNTWGEITLSTDTNIRLPTFLGEFEVGIVVDPQHRFSAQNTLTIRMDEREYIYDLHGQDFHVEFHYRTLLVQGLKFQGRKCDRDGHTFIQEMFKQIQTESKKA